MTGTRSYWGLVSPREEGQVAPQGSDETESASHPESCRSGSLAARIYGHVVSLNPLELLLPLLLYTVPLLAGYFVIRLAVRHGVMDAHRRLPPDQSPPI